MVKFLFLSYITSMVGCLEFNIQCASFQEISVSHCLSSEVLNSGLSQTHQGQPLSFFAIDIYAKLVFSILKVGITSLGYLVSGFFLFLVNFQN